MQTKVIVEGLDELRARFAQFPNAYNRVVLHTMAVSLLKLWEHVPGYPAPPPDSSYRRTGTLGRTLGSSQGGGRSGGKPDIFDIKNHSNYTEGKFGTQLSYAQYVIGDYGSQQASHMRHWWTLPQDVLRAAQDGIEKLWKDAGKDLADFLRGKGLL